MIRVTMTGWEQIRPIEKILDSAGNVLNLIPAKKTKNFIDLKLPSGLSVRAEVSSEDFEKMTGHFPPQDCKT